ncbi:MAG: hypothetical protein HYX49_01550 [Chloroflexi bacterium]|nr:hypothetical protein [Chloroflexota bacterium]
MNIQIKIINYLAHSLADLQIPNPALGDGSTSLSTRFFFVEPRVAVHAVCPAGSLTAGC